jgi:hypothetical protein
VTPRKKTGSKKANLFVKIRYIESNIKNNEDISEKKYMLFTAIRFQDKGYKISKARSELKRKLAK